MQLIVCLIRALIRHSERPLGARVARSFWRPGERNRSRAWGKDRDGEETVPAPPVRPGSFVGAVANALAEPLSDKGHE